MCQAAIGIETQDAESIEYKAKFISRAQEISEAAMKSRREAQKPSRNDSIIASLISAPIQQLPNADGAPTIATASANPAVVQVSQLISHRLPRVLSSTSHSQNKRASLIAVAQGGEPPSTKSRTTDELLNSFALIQQQDASYRCARILFGNLLITTLGQQKQRRRTWLQKGSY